MTIKIVRCAICARQIVKRDVSDTHIVGSTTKSCLMLACGQVAYPECKDDEIEWGKMIENRD